MYRLHAAEGTPKRGIGSESLKIDTLYMEQIVVCGKASDLHSGKGRPIIKVVGTSGRS